MSNMPPEQQSQHPNNVNANEQGSAGNSQQQGGDNPSWQEILEALPDDFHPLVKPKLEEWDRGVREKINDVRSQYDPYKKFVEDKVNPELIEYAVGLVHALNEKPEEIIGQAIQELNLGYVPKTELEKLQEQLQQQNHNNEDDPFDFGDGNSVDITKHPAFVQMQQTLESMQGKLTEQEKAEQEAAQNEEFEQYLGTLKDNHGEFDELFVTALMQQGASGEEAVKQYHNIVNQAAARIAQQNQQTTQQQQPPVIMGGDGTTGSGLPEQPVKLGSMSNSDVNQLVVEMLSRQNTQT